ncbi:hypothetical protein [Alteromonas sp. C1M14]|uniref:hypothetical protein n=1 Tax=Alteromonas sp. C1M14 TaxID=2841567 RepID=UPI001C092DFB|nr:hypothetical protein [Alteromonas sp. C1M14]MBU2978662.1 hypothetical protein [Alteromonas sp. C1M14]
MQNYKALRKMRLHASENQDLSSVYGHAVATVEPESAELSPLLQNARAKRRARRWAVQKQTDRVVSAH